MSETAKPALGTCAWLDLTVPDASNVRSFYEHVIGWKSAAVPMGGYDDFAMESPGADKTVAGICHARGPNTGIPPVWLPYFVIADLDASIAAVTQHGGAVVSGPRDMGGWGRMAIIRDPAGAVCALSEPPRG